MEKLISELLNESIKVELNLNKMYTLFSKKFIEDSDFWSQLASEEKDHASLLISGMQIDKVAHNFPVEVLSKDVHKVKCTNIIIAKHIELIDNVTDRKEAGKIALSLEVSSSELSFQSFINKTPENDISKIFVKLNYFDKDHAKRIQEYFKK
jgi:hypothetical protein